MWCNIHSHFFVLRYARDDRRRPTSQMISCKLFCFRKWAPRVRIPRELPSSLRLYTLGVDGTGGSPTFVSEGRSALHHAVYCAGVSSQLPSNAISRELDELKQCGRVDVVHFDVNFLLLLMQATCEYISGSEIVTALPARTYPQSYAAPPLTRQGSTSHGSSCHESRRDTLARVSSA